MRRHAAARASAQGQVLFETLLAGDWFVRQFAVSVETLNGLLFRDVGEIASAEVEWEKDRLIERITDPEFHRQELLALPIAVTPEAMRRFHEAALKRYALAEACPGWETVDVAPRAELANRLFLDAALRFVRIRTALYAGAAVPIDAPFEWRAPDGERRLLRVDRISPVPGYETPG